VDKLEFQNSFSRKSLMYKKGPAGKYLSYLRTNKGFKQTNPFKEIRKINCALPATFNKSSCMHIHIKGKYGKKG